MKRRSTMSPRHARWQRTRGFSLIEIALVLVIVGLALGGIVAALGPQLDNKNVRDTQDRMKQVSDALVAFTIANRRLPCPASAASGGDEVVTGTVGQCTNPNNGFVPARTLGLERDVNGLFQDAWGFGIRYSVTQITYTLGGNAPVSINCNPGPCYPFTQQNGIRNAYYLNGAALAAQPAGASLQQICASRTGATGVACGPAANQIAQTAFVIWSTGRNGSQLPGGNGIDEAANLDGNVVYVSHSRTETGAANGAFDDLMQWQTAAELFLNMTRVGVLP